MAEIISPIVSTMEPPPVPQHPKKRQYTKKEVWMKHRPMIEGPWKDLGYKEIVRLLGGEGFVVTEKQLKDRIRSWGLGKNVNESKRKFIVRKQTQQRANGKDCTFRIWGKTVEPEKISRWQRRDNDADKLLVSGTTVPSPAASTPSYISYTPFTPPVSQNSDHIDAGSYQEVDYEVDASRPISKAVIQQNIYQLHSTTETDSATFEFEKFLVDDLTTFEGRSPAPFTAPSTPALEPSTLDHPIAPRISSPMMNMFQNPSFNWQNLSSWSEKNDDSSTPFWEILSEPISEDIGQHHSPQATTLRPKEYMRYRQKDEDDLSKRYKDLEFRYGADHPATLDTGSRLVQVYICQGRFRSAEALCKQIALAWLVTVGGNDVKTLQEFESLVLIFLNLGQYQLAESLCRQIYTEAQSLMAATDRVLLGFELSLAKCYCFNDAISEAEALYRKILRIGGQYLPPDDLLLIETMKSLSESLRGRDELVESEKLLRVIVQSMELSTGLWEEISLLQVRADLGDILSRKGTPGSGDMLKRVHQDQIILLGPEHTDTIYTQSILADAFMRAGVFRESVFTLEDAVEKANRTLGNKHPLTILYRQQLAQNFVKAKQLGYHPD